MQLRIHRSAEVEYLDSLKYYASEISVSRAGNFRDDFVRTVKLILQFPEGSPLVWKKVRRILFSDFPYGIFYQKIQDTLWIISVSHHSRRPGHWKKRIKNIQ